MRRKPELSKLFLFGGGDRQEGETPGQYRLSCLTHFCTGVKRLAKEQACLLTHNVDKHKLTSLLSHPSPATDRREYERQPLSRPVLFLF